MLYHPCGVRGNDKHKHPNGEPEANALPGGAQVAGPDQRKKQSGQGDDRLVFRQHGGPGCRSGGKPPALAAPAGVQRKPHGGGQAKDQHRVVVVELHPLREAQVQRP